MARFSDIPRYKRLKYQEEWKDMSRAKHHTYGTLQGYIASKAIQEGVLEKSVLKKSSQAQAVSSVFNFGAPLVDYAKDKIKVSDKETGEVQEINPQGRIKILKQAESYKPQSRREIQIQEGIAAKRAARVKTFYADDTAEKVLRAQRAGYTTQVYDVSRAEYEKAMRMQAAFNGEYYGGMGSLPDTSMTGMSVRDDQDQGLLKSAGQKYAKLERQVASKTTKKYLPPVDQEYMREQSQKPFQPLGLFSSQESIERVKSGEANPYVSIIPMKEGGLFSRYAQWVTSKVTPIEVGAYEGIRNKPLTIGLTAASMAVLPLSSAGARLLGVRYLEPLLNPKVAKLAGTAFKIGEKGVGLGLTGAYAVGKGSQIASIKDPYERGLAIGETASTELLPLGAGAKAGSRLARNTELKVGFWSQVREMPAKKQAQFMDYWKEAGRLKGAKPLRDIPLFKVQTYAGKRLPLEAQEAIIDVFQRRGITTGGSLSQKVYPKKIGKTEWSHDIDAYFGKENPAVLKSQSPKEVAKELASEFRKRGFKDFNRFGSEFKFKEGGGKFLEFHAEKFAEGTFTRQGFPYAEKPVKTPGGQKTISLREQARRKVAGAFLDEGARASKDMPSLKELMSKEYEFSAESKGILFKDYTIKAKKAKQLKASEKKGVVTFFGEGKEPSILDAKKFKYSSPYKKGKMLLRAGLLQEPKYQRYRDAFYNSNKFKKAVKSHSWDMMEGEYKPSAKARSKYPSYKGYKSGSYGKYITPILSSRGYPSEGYESQKTSYTPDIYEPEKTTGYTPYKNPKTRYPAYPKINYPSFYPSKSYYPKTYNTRKTMIDIGFTGVPPTRPPKKQKFISLFGGSKTKGKKVKWDPLYFASIEASLFGVKGKKPSKKELATGLYMRPLIS